jgi:hypothetical protein
MAAEPYRWRAASYSAMFEPVFSHVKQMGVRLRPRKPEIVEGGNVEFLLARADA